MQVCMGLTPIIVHKPTHPNEPKCSLSAEKTLPRGTTQHVCDDGETPCIVCVTNKVMSPLGRISEPAFSRAGRRAGTHNENDGFGNVSTRPFHRKTHRSAFFAPQPPSRKSASKFARGGVVPYHSYYAVSKSNKAAQAHPTVEVQQVVEELCTSLKNRISETFYSSPDEHPMGYGQQLPL